MDELILDLLVAFLIVAPVVGALVCLYLRKLPAIGKAVGAVSVLMAISALALLSIVVTAGPFVRDAYGLETISVGITILDLILMLAFLYISWKAKSALAGVFAGLQLVVLTAMEVGGVSEHGAAMNVDQLSVMMAFITSVIGSIICVFAVRYMTHYEDHGRFFAVMLLFLGAMNGAVFSNNLLWLFFFWEVTTLCSYLLIGHTGTKDSRRSAVTAAEYTLGGGLALAVGILLCHSLFGTVFIDQIPEGAALGGLAFLPLALMAVAAFTKSAQIPFQKWLLGAMVAPTPVSALLHSATMVNLGVYLLLRLAPNLQGSGALSTIVALVGVISFVITAVLAMTQSNAKRVLAYSTISNLGLIVACAGLGTSLALTAAMLLLVFHAISKALLFMSVGVIKERTGSEEIDAMEGLRDSMPLVSAMVLVGVSMMIMPPFGMFASKWLLSEAVASHPLIALLLVLGFGATLVYYAKWLGRIFTGGIRRDRLRRDGTPRTYAATLMATATVGILATVLMGPLLDGLINPYISRVFEPALQMGEWGLFTTMGLFPMVALVVLAALLVIAVILPRRAPQVREVYTCGEGSDVQVGTFYYWTEAKVAKITWTANMLMALLIIVMVFSPLIKEVAA